MNTLQEWRAGDVDSARDEQLARRARAGDADACFELCQRYLDRVYRRVRRKVPPQDVDDVTQDVFLAVVRSLSTFEGQSRFTTWMTTIVNRVIADYYRRRSRMLVPAANGETEPDAGVDDAAARDERVQTREALSALPRHYQDVLLARFADGLTFAEIAASRQQSLDAVKSLYRRALHALRESFDAE